MTASNVGTSAYATRQRGLARLASDSCVDASPRTVRAFEFTMVADGFVLTCSETDCCFLGMLLRKITGVHSIGCPVRMNHGEAMGDEPFSAGAIESASLMKNVATELGLDR